MSKERPWFTTSEEEKKKMTLAQLAIDELTDHVNEVCLKHGASCVAIFVVEDNLFSCGTGDGEKLSAGIAHVLVTDKAIREIVHYATAVSSLKLATKSADK